jgi:cytochrome c556
MKKMMAIACVLGLLAGTRSRAGDVEKAEAAMKETMKLMKDFTGILKTMTDEDTVKAAISKLKAIEGRRKEVFNKLESAFKDLSNDDQEAIGKKYDKYKKEVQALVMGLGAETKRVQELPGGKDALKLVGSFFKGPRKEKKEEKKDK